MRVAIDARELCGRPTGVGPVPRGLLDAWATSDDGPAPSVDAASRHAPLDGRRGWTASVEVVGGGGGTVWEQFDAAARRSRGAGPTCSSRRGTLLH